MKIRKTLIVLLLAMGATIAMMAQDLTHNLIDVGQDIRSKAEMALLENQVVSINQLEKLDLYAGRKTSTGYNLIFRHYEDGFYVENDEVKIVLNSDLSVRWTNASMTELRLESKSVITEEKASAIVRTKAGIDSPEIRKLDKVVSKIGDEKSWDKYYRADVRDTENGKRYRLYIRATDGTIVSNGDMYSSRGNAASATNSSSSQSAAPANVCCNNPSDNVRYHPIDPDTSPNCLDYLITTITVLTNGDIFLGNTADNITFSDATAPQADIDGLFCYEIETLDYNKLHSYIYAQQLLGSTITGKPGDVILNVNGSNQPYVDGDNSNNEIVFGMDTSFKDMAADRFHVAHGFFQIAVKNRESNAQIENNLGAGSVDYLVMNHYGDNGNCYNYGGKAVLGLRSVDHNTYVSAIAENGEPAADEAQTWSSYLQRIDSGLGATAGIGHTDTDLLIFEIIDMFNGMSPIQAIQLYFQTAKSAPFIDSEELCRMYNITTDYLDGSGYSVTLTDLPDLYIKDSTSDTGNEPYWLTQMWTSPSIWNTTGSASGPIGNPQTNTTNYIHVQVDAANNNTVSDKYLHVYFSMASMGLSWPTDWQDAWVGQQQVQGEIGVMQINGPGPYYFQWTPPDPSDLSISDKHHVCILARITDEHNTVRNSRCDVEGSGVGWNTNVFNSIAWKNLSILDNNFTSGGNEVERVSVFVQNTNPPEWYENPDAHDDIDLFTITMEINPTPENPVIMPLGDPDPNFFENCEVSLEFDPEFGIPMEDGYTGRGFENEVEGGIRITSPHFVLQDLNLQPGTKYRLVTSYKPLKKVPVSFSLVLRNYLGEIVGGELYQSVFKAGKPLIGKEENEWNKVEVLRASTEIRVVPNPTFGAATISTLKEIATIEVLDNYGMLIEKRTFDRDGITDSTINLEGQQAGLYKVRINFKDGTAGSANLIKK